jgi:hypothetical protein
MKEKAVKFTRFPAISGAESNPVKASQTIF